MQSPSICRVRPWSEINRIRLYTRFAVTECDLFKGRRHTFWTEYNVKVLCNAVHGSPKDIWLQRTSRPTWRHRDWVEQRNMKQRLQRQHLSVGEQWSASGMVLALAMQCSRHRLTGNQSCGLASHTHTVHWCRQFITERTGLTRTKLVAVPARRAARKQEKQRTYETSS